MDLSNPQIRHSLYLFLLILFHSETNEATADHDTHQISLLPGATSYADQLMKASGHMHQMRSLKADQNLKEDFEDNLSTMTSLHSLGEVMRHKGSSGPVSSFLSSHGDQLVTEMFHKILLASSNDTVPSQCINDTGRFLLALEDSKNRNNSWAMQMFDSIGKPGPSLLKGRFTFVGNYKQCRQAQAFPDKEAFSKGFRGEYTVATVAMGVGVMYSPVQIQWGLCFPDTCSAAETTLFLRELLSMSNTTSELNLAPVEIRSDEREYTAATNISIILLGILGFWVIFGTAYDIFCIQRPRWAAENAQLAPQDHANGANEYQVIVTRSGGPTDEHRPLLPNSEQISEPGTFAKVLLSFSLYTNGKKLLSTAQPPGSLGAIHGIRFLSMSWVILGHTYAFGMQYFVNMMDITVYTKRWTFDAVSNALVSVDTFFTLSGLLTAYLTIKEMKRKGWKINWGLFYFHRFWRLTPPYMMTLLLVLGFQRFLGSGALWASTQPADKQNCEKNWWTNLLYINNVVNVKEACFGHAWYLANDMQFFILSPLMLIPFYFNKIAGLASCMTFLLIHWITTFSLSEHYKWPPTFFGTQAGLVGYMMDYYFKPWCRIGPFIVGVGAGFLLAQHKGKVPLNRTINVIGWIVATAVGLSTVYGLNGDISGENPSSVGVAAFYNACARSAWGACVCWVIISCVSGYGGFVNTILSWSPFVVLGRLTYMAYLIHPCIVYSYFANMDELFYNNDMNVIITYLGILLLANMTAFVLVLFLESPMIGLEKALLHRRKD